MARRLCIVLHLLDTICQNGPDADISTRCKFACIHSINELLAKCYLKQVQKCGKTNFVYNCERYIHIGLIQREIESLFSTKTEGLAVKCILTTLWRTIREGTQDPSCLSPAQYVILKLSEH